MTNHISSADIAILITTYSFSFGNRDFVYVFASETCRDESNLALHLISHAKRFVKNSKINGNSFYPVHIKKSRNQFNFCSRANTAKFC